MVKSRKNKSGTRRIIMHRMGDEYLILVRDHTQKTTRTAYQFYTNYVDADMVFDLPLDVLCNENSDNWLSLTRKDVIHVNGDQFLYTITTVGNKLALFNNNETVGCYVNLLWEEKASAQKMCSELIQNGGSYCLHVIPVDRSNYNLEELSMMDTLAGPAYAVFR